MSSRYQCQMNAASLSPNILSPIKISLEKLANNIGCIQDKNEDNYQANKVDMKGSWIAMLTPYIYKWIYERNRRKPCKS